MALINKIKQRILSSEIVCYLFHKPKMNFSSTLSGNFLCWSVARSDSSGYDSDLILEKTKEALLKVKNKEAVYERDSVLFDEIQYSWPLLAGLMSIAAKSKGHLNVMDFGGSLGSTYFQNRKFLRCLEDVRWNIVEQPNHFRVGKEIFEDGTLFFYSSIENCLAQTQPNVILFNGVLQYLELPYQTIENAIASGCNFIIIDRTPLSEIHEDRLCIQEVIREIYPVSYPSWIFSKEKFINFLFKNGFCVLAQFESLDEVEGPVIFSYQGMILTRKSGVKA
jgi:putative methyltransferase (TIGR04325 family)